MLTTMSSVPFQQKALSSSKAWGYLALNQLAFPGAGTVMGGRREGYVQAVVMVIGFVLTMVYFLAMISSVVNNAFDFTANAGMSEQQLHSHFHRYAWAGEIGGILCTVAWFWSLASSILMLRNAQKDPPVLS